MNGRLPVDRRVSTWLDYSSLVDRPLPVRDDPTTYVPDRRRAAPLARLLSNAILRGDRAAQLIVEGAIAAATKRVAPSSESEKRAMWGDR